MTSTNTATTTYLIEFGKLGDTYPVPPIVIDYSDPNEAARTVARHAIPYLKPVLEQLGRPELADCFFHTDAALAVGEFMYLDLAGGKGARFCPARLTAASDPNDDPICGDPNDGDWCELEPGHDGHHRADTAEWANAPAPASAAVAGDGQQQ
jgi:hypothetical protein